MFRFTPSDLRNLPTVSERILWNHLRSRRLLGLKFRRQHSIGPFIVDFICLSHKVVIELDGPIHRDRTSYDERRDLWLKSQGYAVLRIKNEELELNREEALLRIREFLMTRIEF